MTFGPRVSVPGGWAVSSPETANEFSAIGYVFGFYLQPALDIPVGIIKNARGGASIESMVPVFKFDEHPLAKAHADYVRQRMAEFDLEAEIDKMWDQQKSKAKKKGEPEPPRPAPSDLRSWNVPGKSPGHMGSVHNGFFGVFKGYNFKGVLFHQGYNNQMHSSLRPKLYRVLTRLMIEGWREEFNDPQLPVAVIGFNAGGETQNEENFEKLSIAGEDGKFYMAHARHAEWEGSNSANGWREIHVWSPLVDKSVAVRYAWANSPMGNLYFDGYQDLPFPSFRTDSWDWPEPEDPTGNAMSRSAWNKRKADAAARLEERKIKDAEMAKKE